MRMTKEEIAQLDIGNLKCFTSSFIETTEDNVFTLQRNGELFEVLYDIIYTYHHKIIEDEDAKEQIVLDNYIGCISVGAELHEIEIDVKSDFELTQDEEQQIINCEWKFCKAEDLMQYASNHQYKSTLIYEFNKMKREIRSWTAYY